MAESLARRILKTPSIDMVYAPLLLVAQMHNVRNDNLVLRLLLLVSSARTFLCFVFDALCPRPYSWYSGYKQR